MSWAERYPQATRPAPEEIDAYVNSPLWAELKAFLAEQYGAAPRIEYSRCGLEPGWNMKFKKGSRPLCTVYVRPGFVTAMVSVAPKDEAAALALLPACTAYTRDLYHRTASSKMGRWLMVEVTAPEILEDVKALLRLRANTRRN